MGFDQLVIGDKASHDDFGASVSARNIGDPKKKKITKTVPFSNRTYDFTKINGQIYWEQRQLDYTFEMVANSPEELEDMKTAFNNFVMNVIDEPIYDPFIRDYHFIGTYEDKSYTDDEDVEKTTVTVTFLAYPYKVANEPKEYTFSVAASSNTTVEVYNDSSHKITPVVEVNGEVRIVYGNSSVALKSGTYENEVFALEIGANSFYIENLKKEESTVKITFVEEVF